MFTILENDTADNLWLGAVDRFRKGTASAQSSRGGSTDEVLHAALCLRDPRQRWVASRFPALNPAFALAEVVWMLRGRNDSVFLNYFNSELVRFAGNGAEFHGAYGHRLRHRMGIDQLVRGYRALQANPESRQVVLQIWDAQSDMPTEDGVATAEDIPCNVCAMLKVREGRLEWTQVMRSNDLYRGLPYNIVQFTTLHEVMAGWLGLELGHYNHLSDSLHVYKDTAQHVLDSTKVNIGPNADSLAATFEQTEIITRELENLVMKIIDRSCKSELLVSELAGLPVPPAWKNIASVLVAEGARRRRDNASVENAMSYCSNKVFGSLFERWLVRVSPSK